MASLELIERRVESIYLYAVQGQVAAGAALTRRDRLHIHVKVLPRLPSTSQTRISSLAHLRTKSVIGISASTVHCENSLFMQLLVRMNMANSERRFDCKC